jgi:hypothetical protein
MFFGASLDGGVVGPRRRINERFYGKGKKSPADIVTGDTPFPFQNHLAVKIMKELTAKLNEAGKRKPKKSERRKTTWNLTTSPFKVKDVDDDDIFYLEEETGVASRESHPWTIPITRVYSDPTSFSPSKHDIKGSGVSMDGSGYQNSSLTSPAPFYSKSTIYDTPNDGTFTSIYAARDHRFDDQVHGEHRRTRSLHHDRRLFSSSIYYPSHDRTRNDGEDAVMALASLSSLNHRSRLSQIPHDYQDHPEMVDNSPPRLKQHRHCHSYGDGVDGFYMHPVPSTQPEFFPGINDLDQFCSQMASKRLSNEADFALGIDGLDEICPQVASTRQHNMSRHMRRQSIA